MAVTVETLERGDGETYARTGERVDVFYVGMLPSGAVFDSTESDRLRRSAAVGTSSLEAEAEGETARTFDLRWHKALTFNIGLGHVIRGLEEGVAQMSLGERARLRIPAESAYGEVITMNGGDSCPDLGLPSPSSAPQCHQRHSSPQRLVRVEGMVVVTTVVVCAYVLCMVMPPSLRISQKEFRDSNDKVVVPAGSDVIFEVELLRIWCVHLSRRTAPRLCSTCTNRPRKQRHHMHSLELPGRV